MDEDYFYSLVRKKGEKKVRNCLKCNTPFDTKSVANRICSECNLQNKRLSVNSTYAIFEQKKVR